MDVQVTKRDWLFLLVCIGLGILAEIIFFHGEIGLSYLVFIAVFYAVFFLKIRIPYQRRRIGLLLMAAVWILAGSYLFYSSTLFYPLNLVLIPALVFFHLIMITSPNKIVWSKPTFVILLITKLKEAIQYSTRFCRVTVKPMNEEAGKTIKRIVIGLVTGIPLLLVIIGLLMSADKVFQDMMLKLPSFMMRFNFTEDLFRLIVVIVLSLLFFGIFQVLPRRTEIETNNVMNPEKKHIYLDSVIVVTILAMLNLVYAIFVAIQFTYFFGGGLQAELTYAEYARRGFFELMIVTLINWTLLIFILKRVNTPNKAMKLTLKILNSLLIIVSGVMLVSAFGRLSMYEAAYGFTVDRILAHAFMIFLMVIFAYTFIRVWIERLALLHFYLITSLLFYVVLNVIHIEQIIVTNNLERYEQTEKIDIYYLSTLSYTGIEALIELYKMEPDYPDLQRLLKIEQRKLELEPNSWQSFNFKKQEVIAKIQSLEL
ncbi:DUF4153 domain-containing protein [Oceanobacillus polygoni]|uniref:Preprotein translocase subunit Sss1 n=1 Tax=Oceanobacillus polygoni TaxID=1235259 RepID=A0A9X0YW84_9BACI|nr:DUF4173 domain-containing protein [Oceanobacillus polygoni]MBP2080018.1 preprotein translocase subunit Sss1 [Oceanobacillus polygoni]